MISTTKELVRLKSSWENKKIGLVTGCFDVLHYGHVSLLEFAKQHVDTLIVGVDSDESIKVNKGSDRPIFVQEARLKVIDALKLTDYTFLIDHKIRYVEAEKINRFFIDLYKRLEVTHIITNMQADSSYRCKLQHADLLNIECLLQTETKFSSSSDIISKLGL